MQIFARSAITAVREPEMPVVAVRLDRSLQKLTNLRAPLWLYLLFETDTPKEGRKAGKTGQCHLVLMAGRSVPLIPVRNVLHGHGQKQWHWFEKRMGTVFLQDRKYRHLDEKHVSVLAVTMVTGHGGNLPAVGTLILLGTRRSP